MEGQFGERTEVETDVRKWNGKFGEGIGLCDGEGNTAGRRVQEAGVMDRGRNRDG